MVDRTLKHIKKTDKSIDYRITKKDFVRDLVILTGLGLVHGLVWYLLNTFFALPMLENFGDKSQPTSFSWIFGLLFLFVIIPFVVMPVLSYAALANSDFDRPKLSSILITALLLILLFGLVSKNEDLSQIYFLPVFPLVYLIIQSIVGWQNNQYLLRSVTFIASFSLLAAYLGIISS